MEDALPGRKALTADEISRAMDMLGGQTMPEDPARSFQHALAKREAVNGVCRMMGWRNPGTELYTIGEGEREVTVSGTQLDNYCEYLRHLAGHRAPTEPHL